MPNGILLNVNVPNIPENELKGIRITKQGNLVFRDKFEKREDPRGKTYYWMGGDHSNKHEDGTDGLAIKEGFISITPIHYRLTEESFIENLNNWGF